MVFKEAEVLRIIESRTPQEVAALPIDFLRRRAKKVAIVCGPVSTGNGRSPDENRRRVAAVMSALRRKGVTVFNQFLFLKQIEKLRGVPHYHDRTYVREIFHLPLLRSGWVRTVYFTLEWRKSEGARWYYERAKELGLEIRIVQPKNGITPVV